MASRLWLYDLELSGDGQIAGQVAGLIGFGLADVGAHAGLSVPGLSLVVVIARPCVNPDDDVVRAGAPRFALGGEERRLVGRPGHERGTEQQDGDEQARQHRIILLTGWLR